MKVTGIWLATLVLAVCASPAFADVIIDFSGGAGGAVSYNSGTKVLTTTTGILISNVAGVGTPAHSEVAGHAVGSGTLSINATGGSFSGGFFSFTGGTYTVTGGVADAGIATGTTLLSGTLSQLIVSLQDFSLVIANGTDTKDAALVSYFGLVPAQTSWLFKGATTHLFNVVGGTNGTSFSASTNSTDIQNTAVPEPSSVLLLGTALLFAGKKLQSKFKS